MIVGSQGLGLLAPEPGVVVRGLGPLVERLWPSWLPWRPTDLG